MEARLYRAALIAACVLSLGASYRTENFIVSAPTVRLAKEVGDSAEAYRRDLAIEWLGEELPPWRDMCPIRVHEGARLGAGGATSFMFEGGQPFGWTMSIQGSRERILDSVLPHEITHTVFATHFGRPLPRWADEGACTTVEHISERDKQHRMLYEFLTTGRGIAFNHMFAMKEYPRDVLPLYSQGYSLARFLIAQGGKHKFIDYVGDGMAWNSWTKATNEHYGFKSLSELQVTWLDWVRRGSPSLQAPATLVAQQDEPPADDLVAVADARNITSQPDAPRSATPATEVVPASMQSGSTSRGWYARIRDAAFARDREGGSGAEQSPPANGESPSPTTSPATVSRQQPVVKSQQVILEWTRPSNQSAPTTAPAAAAAPRAYLVSPERLRGTILR